MKKGIDSDSGGTTVSGMQSPCQSLSKAPVSAGALPCVALKQRNKMKIGTQVYNGNNKSILWTVTGIEGEWLKVRATDPSGGLHFVNSVLHVEDVVTIATA